VQKCLDIGNSKEMPREWTDFILMRDIYHCTPEEMDKQDDTTIDMHAQFVNMLAEHAQLTERRSTQRAKHRKL